MGTDITSGGFAGDPAEAFTPPAAGGCCGTAPAAVASTTVEVDATGGCCGSPVTSGADGCCAEPVAAAPTIAAASARCCE